MLVCKCGVLQIQGRVGFPLQTVYVLLNLNHFESSKLQLVLIIKLDEIIKNTKVKSNSLTHILPGILLT